MKLRNKPTVNALAHRAGVGWATMARWMRRTDFPGDDASDAVLKDYAATQLSEAAKKSRGQDADLRRAKLEAQVQLLREQARRARADAATAEMTYQQARAQLMPFTEHLAEVREIATITKAGLTQFVQWCTSEFRDAEIYKKAVYVAERTCLWLEQKVNEATVQVEPEAAAKCE